MQNLSYSVRNSPYSTASSGASRNSNSQAQALQVSDLLDLIRFQIASASGSQSGIKYSFSSMPVAFLPSAIAADRDLLEKVLHDLFQHAAGSLGGPQGHIRLSLETAEQYMVIAIEDNGRGLSEEQLEKLEEKGLRTSLAQIRAIRELANQGGWRCRRQARLGVGARLIIEIPAVFPQAQRDPSLRRA